MIEKEIDLWEIETDYRCITTNGTITDGRNPMGAGCALEAKERFPGIERNFARYLEKWGHHVGLMAPGLLIFPVKHVVWEKADPKLIERSIGELERFIGVADVTVAIPRPGCGAGGLQWEDVGPMFEHLDNRFIVVDYPKGEIKSKWPPMYTA